MEPNQPLQQPVSDNQVRPMIKPKMGKKFNKLYLVLGVVLVVGIGVVSGWLLSGKSLQFGKKSGSLTSAPTTNTNASEAGVADDSLYSETAQGTLEEGGISGEGTHHLARPGGDSQNIYLISTAFDLQSFVGKKVQVWGNTISSKKAGWLMDVGRIKTID